MSDKRVIQCNYREGTPYASAGARAYLITSMPGSMDGVWVLVRSRGGRWIQHWERPGRLMDFRFKTLPPEHPLYDDKRIADCLTPDHLQDCLRWSERETESRCVMRGPRE